MSLGVVPTGHRASGGGGSAPPHTRPTTSNEGAHSPSSSLLIHLPWTAEPLKPHALPLALRLAFDGGGDVPHGQGHRSNRGQRARGHRQHRGVAGASPGAVQDLTGLVGAQLFATMIWQM